MSKLNEQQILDALRNVIDPDLHRDIVALGFVKDIKICDGNVSFKVELTTPACPVKDILKQQCEENVQNIPGVTSVHVEMTAQVRQRKTQTEDLLPDVKQCIAIASGKGGVGKSTMTVNLAIVLAQMGAKVGVLDADVYGPSIPMMLGCEGEKPLSHNGKILPIEKYGIQLMSLGFLLDPDQAVLWRGPMVAGTVRQLLADVDWGVLDYLLVDLPPGTGDAPMSLAQLAPLTGVVIVTTPHTVAANIASKSAALFKRLNTPVLGIAENMGTHVCPKCSHESRIFSGLSGEDMAHSIHVPYLGTVPLDPAVSNSSANGVPSVISDPNRLQAEAFRKVAKNVAAQASIVEVARKQDTKKEELVEVP